MVRGSILELFGITNKYDMSVERKIVPEDKKTLSLDDAREKAKMKYLELFEQFQSCYDKYWKQWNYYPNETIPPYIGMFRGRLKELEMKGEFAHMDLVETVVHSHKPFEEMFKSLKYMDQQLAKPIASNLELFGSTKAKIKREIDNYFKSSYDVTKYLLLNKTFQLASGSDLTRESLPLFKLYYDLSKTQKEYYDAMCAERDSKMKALMDIRRNPNTK